MGHGIDIGLNSTPPASAASPTIPLVAADAATEPGGIEPTAITAYHALIERITTAPPSAAQWHAAADRLDAEAAKVVDLTCHQRLQYRDRADDARTRGDRAAIHERMAREPVRRDAHVRDWSGAIAWTGRPAIERDGGEVSL